MQDTYSLWILDEALVRFPFVKVAKIPLSVRENCIDVCLMLHC